MWSFLCHTVEFTKFLYHLKIFREINCILNSLLKKLFSRNFFKKSWYKTFVKSSVIMHTVEITEIYSHRNRISSNHLFSNFSSKNVTITKFLPKKVRVNFRNFHTLLWYFSTTLWCLNYGNLLSRCFGKNFVKTTHLLNM